MAQRDVRPESHSRGENLDERRLIERYGLARILVTGVVVVGSIAVLWIPLQAVLPIANVLAGKKTSLSVTVTLTFVFTIAFGGTTLLLLIKNRRQRADLRRQRRRMGALEERIQVLQGRLRDLGETP